MRTGDKGSGGARADILAIVEAAYAIEAPPRPWALRLLESTARVVGAGISAFACAFEETNDGRIRFDRGSVASLGVNDDMLESIFASHEQAPTGALAAVFAKARGTARCILTSEAIANKTRFADGPQSAGGAAHDGINIAATDVDDRGFLISIAVPAGYRLSDRTRQALARVGNHVLAAMRLRRRLGHTDRFAPDGEAKLAEARRALVHASKTIEHVRTSMRSEADGPLELWKGLISARWTMVDSFDREGARYVVARENRRAATGPESLTQTERAVVSFAARGLSTKEIAHALGISDATVRVLVMRAMRRCGVTSRNDLIARWQTSTAEGKITTHS
jgi:DNA-binding CsgD family transcriptional regulator